MSRSNLKENNPVATLKNLILSVSRVSGTNLDFSIELNPVLPRIRKLRLRSANFPFNFNNVTENYGNTLQFRLAWGLPEEVFEYTIQIPRGRYTMPQLISLLNQLFINAFGTLSPPYNVSPITFAFGDIPQVVSVLFDTSNFSGGGTLTFVKPSSIKKAHIYRMLGMNTEESTSYSFGSSSFLWPLPHTATTNIPISHIIIHIQGVPTKVVSTGQITGQFLIDLSTKAPTIGNDTLETPNSYRESRDYKQSIYIPDDFFNFQEVRIRLTDANGLSLEEQGPTEWWMVLETTSYWIK